MSVYNRKMFRGSRPTAQDAQQALDVGITSVMADMSRGVKAAKDYEQAINAFRGDQKPMKERRQELAGIVGMKDAKKTPESVVTLVQPVMEMRQASEKVDQGIGQVAQQAMDTPVQGKMAGGIMQPVQMKAGGAASLAELYRQNMPVIQEMFGDQSAALKKQALGQLLLGGVAPAGLAIAQGTPVSEALMQLGPYAAQLGAGVQQSKMKQDAAARQAALNLATTQQAAQVAARKPVTLAEGQALVDPQTGKTIVSGPKKPAGTTSLAPGSVLVDSATGKEIARGPDKPAATTSLAPGSILVDSATGKELARGPEKPAQTAVLGPGQVLLDQETGKELGRGPEKAPEVITLAPGAILVDKGTGKQVAKGPTQIDAATLSPGQVLVNKDTGEEIASGPDKVDTSTLAPGTILVDSTTGKEIARGADKPTETKVLAPGSILVDESGKQIAAGPEKVQTFTPAYANTRLIQLANPIATGTADETQLKEFQTAIQVVRDTPKVVTGEGGVGMVTTGGTVPPFVIEAIRKAKQLDPNFDDMGLLEQAEATRTASPEFEGIIDVNIDYTESIGPRAKITRGVQKMQDFFGTLFSGPGAYKPGDRTAFAAVNDLQFLNTITVTRALNAIGGKDTEGLRARIESLQVDPYSGTLTKSQLLSSTQNMLSFLRDNKAKLEGQYEDANSKQVKSKKRDDIDEMDYLISEYEKLEKSLQSGGVDPRLTPSLTR